MAMPRLKTPKPPSAANNSPPPPAEEEVRPVPLPPLNICGVVVRKQDLVRALQVFVPTLADIQAFEDAEHFYLVLSGEGQGAGDNE